MFVLRPVREADLPKLVELARSISGGLTTLPANETFLEERIDQATRAFSPKIKRPGGEYYLFVLERPLDEEIVGTAAIASRVGGFDPFYSYEVQPEKFIHPPLKIAKDIPVLHLKVTHRGPSEICSLFLRADCRRGGLGRLLSLARFIFMRCFPARFDATVIAELRGYLDQENKSPFWESVGRHFFEHDFYHVDQLSGLGNKEFIADLMPKHPIYLPLLPPGVQAVIGRVHHETVAALNLLLAEGFVLTNEVDIFDAGPLLRAPLTEVRTVRETRVVTVEKLVPPAPPVAPTHLVGNQSLEFRATVGSVSDQQGRAEAITLERSIADALGVRVGEQVSLTPLR